MTDTPDPRYVPCTLVERLRGKVRVPVNDGAGPLQGLEYFERQFPASKLALEAADEIERLTAALSGSQPPATVQASGKLDDLRREYRPSMPEEVLRAWAADVVAALDSSKAEE